MAADTRRATVNRHLSASSAYWRWLVKRGHAPTNPWREQSLSKSGPHSPDTEPRPFTDAELATLLAGSPDAELSDAIRVAALSGMRIEEIYRLTVADASHGWFRVRATKTKAGRRRVPVHSALAPIIERRTAAKAPGAYPLSQNPARSDPGVDDRWLPASGSPRIAARGVDERPGGQRQSRVNFHSLRRWFVTRLGRGLTARLWRQSWGMKRATSPTTSIQAAQTTKRGSGVSSQCGCRPSTSSPLATPWRTPGCRRPSDPGGRFSSSTDNPYQFSIPCRIASNRTVSLTFLVVQPVSSQPPRKPKELAGVASCNS